MKYILSTFILMVILVSCKKVDQSKNISQESVANETVSIDSTSNAVTISFKAIDTDEALVETALMAAPEASRAECKVIGFNMAGEFVTFKEGTNEFICLVDNANQNGFNAACYHKSLEPFMARGRELSSEGKTGQEIFDIREAEVKSGKLKIEHGSTLHIYYGPETLYDPETSKVKGAQYRYVVYLPFATSESTGLPEKPYGPDHPWIMNPGTHRAHIMITPVPER